MCKDKKRTPLHFAALGKAALACKYFVQSRSCRFEAPDADNKIALSLCSSEFYEDFLKLSKFVWCASLSLSLSPRVRLSFSVHLSFFLLFIAHQLCFVFLISTLAQVKSRTSFSPTLTESTKTP